MDVSRGVPDIFFALARAQFAGASTDTKTGAARSGGNILSGLVRLAPAIFKVLTAATPLGIAMLAFSGAKLALDVASNPPSSRDKV